MPRVRTKAIHPYIQKWMDDHRCTTLKEAAEKLGLPEGTLRRWANGDATFTLENAKKAALAWGVPLQEWIQEMQTGAEELLTA